MATDGDQFTLWKDNITETSAACTRQAGRKYDFYSVATDNLGLTEILPAQADIITTVSNISSNITLAVLPGSVTEDGATNLI